MLLWWIVGVTSFTLLGSMYARRYERSDLLVGLYVTFVLAAQILAIKVAQFSFGVGEVYVPAGVLVFSVTFLLTDIVNEKFGRKETQRMIAIAFVTQVAATFFFWIATHFQTAPPFAAVGEKWDSLFAFVPQITFASWVAFLVSENLDAYLFSWFRRMTGEKHLWLRNVCSTLPALAIDSIIFVPLAFFGAPIETLWMIVMGQVVVKWLVGLVNIPFIYLNHLALFHGKAASDIKVL